MKFAKSIFIIAFISSIVFPNTVCAIEEEEINQLTQLMIVGCTLGQKFEISVDVDGNLTVLKKGLGGVEGSFDASKTEIPSIITFLETDIIKKEVDDNIRQCMMRYMDRIFDEVLKSEPVIRIILNLVNKSNLTANEVTKIREFINGSAPSEDKWKVIGGLGKPSNTNVIPLLQEIIRESNDYNSRYLATVALGEIGRPAQTALLEALGHQEPSVRYTALKGLAQLPTSPIIVSQIREVLRNDPNSLVKSVAVEALGQLNASEAVDDIIYALHNELEVVRMQAAQVLGHFNFDKVKKALRETALQDPEYRPRLFAIESLVKLKDSNAIPIFDKRQTDDPNEIVRNAAKEASFISKNWPQ